MTTSTTTNGLLQHPSHEHPLEPLDLRSHESIIPKSCELCRRKISAEAYTCHEGCKSYYHRVCAEAPPQIERHPLHPDHPLTLDHERSFECDACSELFLVDASAFSCDTCDFDLDLCCVFSTLSDRGGSQGGKTPEQITHLLHPHSLTSFSTRHDFNGVSNCMLCHAHVEGDGYMCLRRWCKFIIHKRCIQHLYYEDGTKAPLVHHDHQLETFVGKDSGSRKCARCRSDASPGEFIGCAQCQVFIHRDCIKVQDVLQYPPHPGHALVLFINQPDNRELRCQSCSSFLDEGLCYRCSSCEFLVHVGCVLQTLAYCEEGMSVEINLSWHEHSLCLCHSTESLSGYCFDCGDELNGPTYACSMQDCGFILHQQCAKSMYKQDRLYHPDHPLTMCKGMNPPPRCEACCKPILGFGWCCECCALYFHERCNYRVPARKHYLHQHELLQFDEVPSLECNRCGTSTGSPLFRCVPCNFNLHEKCMELPQVVKSEEIHWHTLTLRETFVEDDSGEYYCEHCEKTRDHLLGVYVCGECKISIPRIYHIECVLPELRRVYAKNGQTSAVKRLDNQIAKKNEEVHSAEEKLEEVKRELDEMMKQRAKLVSEEG